MDKYATVVFTFYVWVLWNGGRKKVKLATIVDDICLSGNLFDVQRRLNNLLADVRGENNFIVNSEIKGEARIILRNED